MSYSTDWLFLWSRYFSMFGILHCSSNFVSSFIFMLRCLIMSIQVSEPQPEPQPESERLSSSCCSVLCILFPFTVCSFSSPFSTIFCICLIRNNSLLHRLKHKKYYNNWTSCLKHRIYFGLLKLIWRCFKKNSKLIQIY